MSLPLAEGLFQYLQQRIHPLHIPAHQGGHGLDEGWRQWLGENLWRLDLTEVPGLDDLHAPLGMIARAQEEAAKTFGADETFFLVQGATVGIQAMVMATAGPGEKLALPRFAHRSAFSAMVLSGAEPRYLRGVYHREGGFPLAVAVEEVAKALREKPKGLLMVHPPYFGTASDIERIGALCREQGVALLADEAHGSTFVFHAGLPAPALRAGAAYAVQSAHKGLGSLGQTAFLHVGKGGDGQAVRKALEILQTTSPSYPLMASLDLARWQMANNGRTLLEKALEQAQWARKKINACKGFRCLGEEIVGEAGVFAYDPTKLVILPPKGMSGYETARYLLDKHRIQVEAAGPRYVAALVTIGTRQESLQALVRGIEELDRQILGSEGGPDHGEEPMAALEADVVLTPREAFFAGKRTIPWEDAVGEIAGETVTPYPPGIPLIAPGERITREILELYDWYRRLGAAWQGLSDGTGRMVRIVAQ